MNLINTSTHTDLQHAALSGKIPLASKKPHQRRMTTEIEGRESNKIPFDSPDQAAHYNSHVANSALPAPSPALQSLLEPLRSSRASSLPLPLPGEAGSVRIGVAPGLRLRNVTSNGKPLSRAKNPQAHTQLLWRGGAQNERSVPERLLWDSLFVI